VRIAHLSDLHLANLRGAVPTKLLNKRITGYLNLKLRRGSIHKLAMAQKVAQAIRRGSYDHVVITGDLTNLSLEREFQTVRRFLDEDLALPPEQVSIVPGNHDAYVAGAFRRERFQQYLGEFMTSDLPVATFLPGIRGFPFVRWRGPVALIGLSTARPRPPLVASGRVGSHQCVALSRALDHPETQRRTVVVLQHHPWHGFASLTKTRLEGLVDAGQQLNALSRLPRGLLLHGHLHRRVRRRITTEVGHLDAVGTTSASLVHHHPDKAAGFNVYEIADDGAITDVSALRVDPETGATAPAELPIG